MLFNSYVFIFLFFPATFLGFFWISRNSRPLAALWLAAASVFFYGWWDAKYVALLLASAAFNFAMGSTIARARDKPGPRARGTALLAFAITANLALLGYYKYTNFFVSTANQVAGLGWIPLDIILPLGISFFTFTQIAYLVDVHRGIAREYNLIHYLLFVTYFPHLIAGPVLHHKQMMPQFASSKTYKIDIHNVNSGLTIFAIGLFKKVVLADQFAVYANPVFNAVSWGGEPKLIEAWTGALAYALQLYFDFSGYSDMAIGMSRMLNIRLPLNFNSPYKATNIIEFWRRWHMTLSAFLRDYLYFPLGGNRKGSARRYLNLLATMLLGGLWHGASWTFVLWGGLHGVYLIINHGWRALKEAFKLPAVPGASLIAGALTFVSVVAAWVPFRAESFGAAVAMLKGMAGLHGVSLPPVLAGSLSGLTRFGVEFWGASPLTTLPILEVGAWLAAGLAIVWLLPNAQQIFSITEQSSVRTEPRLPKWLYWRASRVVGAVTGIGFAISLVCISRASQFLYFQF
jgi:alginate O-acetyltransferase complex protein AlgI